MAVEGNCIVCLYGTVSFNGLRGIINQLKTYYFKGTECMGREGVIHATGLSAKKPYREVGECLRQPRWLDPEQLEV